MYKYINVFLLGFFGLQGCGQGIEPGNFDVDRWKADLSACQGIRPQLVAQLEELRPQLYRQSPREVMAVLGRPDAEEIREGAQRVFIYYLEPGPHCQNRQTLSGSDKLLVRFNALNQVTEALYSRPIGDILQKQ